MQKKYVLIALVAVLIAGGAVAAWIGLHPGKSEGLTLYGNVDVRQVSLAFDNADRLREMRVEEGDKVHAGQILAMQDTQALTLQADEAMASLAAQQQQLQRLLNGSRPQEIAQAKAKLASADASARLAEQQLKRLQEIAFDTHANGVSKDALDSANAQLSVSHAQRDDAANALQLAVIGPRQEDIDKAKADVGVAKAQVALLEYRISQGVLKASANGVIRSRLLEPGDMALAQRPVYTLALTDPKWVRAWATEVQLGQLHPGMAAQVFTDSQPDKPISGVIGYISSMAEFTPKTVETEELRTSLIYEVRVWVKDSDDRLRLGMPATVRLMTPAGEKP